MSLSSHPEIQSNNYTHTLFFMLHLCICVGQYNNKQCCHFTGYIQIHGVHLCHSVRSSGQPVCSGTALNPDRHVFRRCQETGYPVGRPHRQRELVKLWRFLLWDNSANHSNIPHSWIMPIMWILKFQLRKKDFEWKGKDQTGLRDQRLELHTMRRRWRKRFVTVTLAPVLLSLQHH